MNSNYFVVGRTNYAWWVSIQVLAFTTSLVIFLKYGVWFGVLIGFLSLVLTILFWTRTVVLEGLAGNHTFQLINSFKFSFLLFILSEVMVFFRVFWAFFDASLSPGEELGEVWVPMGITPISPFSIPLFNTVVLLSRGATLTWAHHCVLSRKNAVPGLVSTILLAARFEVAQYVEFKEATFSIRDGVYGSIFFFGTGLHGLHVIFGHLFLIYNLIRLILIHFRRLHHLRLEFAIIYWHFVDVVWVFLYVCIYWWVW